MDAVETHRRQLTVDHEASRVLPVPVVQHEARVEEDDPSVLGRLVGIDAVDHLHVGIERSALHRRLADPKHLASFVDERLHRGTHCLGVRLVPRLAPDRRVPTIDVDSLAVVGAAHPDHELRPALGNDCEKVSRPVEEVLCDQSASNFVFRDGARRGAILVIGPPRPLRPGRRRVAGEVDRGTLRWARFCGKSLCW